MPLYEVILPKQSPACEWSVPQYPAYYPLAITPDCMDWLVQHVDQQEWTYAHQSHATIEQGGARLLVYDSIRFIFTDPDIAMRFKLTWA